MTVIEPSWSRDCPEKDKMAMWISYLGSSMNENQLSV